MGPLLALMQTMMTDPSACIEYAESFSRYALLWPTMGFVKNILIGQSPYNRNIFPYYAPAFSYDVEKHGALLTPSVEMMLRAIEYQYDDLPTGFEERMAHVMTHSHKLLKNGYLLINATYSRQAHGIHTVRHMTVMARAIRWLVTSRPNWKDQDIRVYAFGNLAAELASLVSSSLGSDIRITVTRTVHPAALARMTQHEREKRKYFGNWKLASMLRSMVSNFVEGESDSMSAGNREIFQAISGYARRIQDDYDGCDSALSIIESRIVQKGRVDPLDVAELIKTCREMASVGKIAGDFISYTEHLLTSAREGPGNTAQSQGPPVRERRPIEAASSGEFRTAPKALGMEFNPFGDTGTVASVPESQREELSISPFSPFGTETSSIPLDVSGASRGPVEEVTTGVAGLNPFGSSPDCGGVTATPRPTGSLPFLTPPRPSDARDAVRSTSLGLEHLVDPSSYSRADEERDVHYLENVETPAAMSPFGPLSPRDIPSPRTPSLDLRTVIMCSLAVEMELASLRTTQQGKVVLASVRKGLSRIKGQLESEIPYSVEADEKALVELLPLLSEEKNPHSITTDPHNRVGLMIRGFATA